MPRTFLICSKTRWRSALSFGSRNTKAPSLVRSSITFFTAALTSSSVKVLVGAVSPEVDAAGATAAGVAVALSLVGAAAGAGVIAGVLRDGWSAALRGAATAKHSAAAIAVALAIETRPRSELSYIIGLNFLSSRALMHRLDVKAPGTETALAASRVPAPKGRRLRWIQRKLTPLPDGRQIKLV